MKMEYRTCCAFVLAAIIFAASDQQASAQVARYQPNRATISPYLSIQGANQTRLPSYFRLVRPQQAQQTTNRLNQDIIARQSQKIDELSTVEALPLKRTTTVGLVAPTGKNGWFMVQSRRATHRDTRSYYATPVIRQPR